MSTPQTPPLTFADHAQGLAKENAGFAGKSNDDLLQVVTAANNYVSLLAGYMAKTHQLSVMEVLKAGYALTALQKKMAHGEFGKLIKDKLSQISTATVYRYIRVAKTYPDPTKLSGELTVTDLYRKAGALPESKSARTKTKTGALDRQPTFADLPARVGAMRKFMTGFNNSKCIGTIPANERARLADEIGVLVKALEAIRWKLLPSPMQSPPKPLVKPPQPTPPSFAS